MAACAAMEFFRDAPVLVVFFLAPRPLSLRLAFSQPFRKRLQPEDSSEMIVAHHGWVRPDSNRRSSG